MKFNVQIKEMLILIFACCVSHCLAYGEYHNCGFSAEFATSGAEMPAVVSCIWDLVEYSPVHAKLVVVIVGSLGGVFNGFAYTAIRHKMNTAKTSTHQPQ